MRPAPQGTPLDGRTLVSCGSPMAGVELRIVHPDTRAVLEEGRVGEVWLSSACVAAGYHGKAALSADVFQVCFQCRLLWHYCHSLCYSMHNNGPFLHVLHEVYRIDLSSLCCPARLDAVWHAACTSACHAMLAECYRKALGKSPG